MDLWAIFLTATVGLAGGLIGAWLQGRRDAQAQKAREESEIERLRLQLAVSREQRERELTQADTLEWRQRRLAAHQKTSSLLDAFLKETHSVTDLETATDVSTIADLCSSLVEELSEALEASALIGAKANRTAASSLAIAAEELCGKISSFEQHASSIGENYPGLLREVQRANWSGVSAQSADAAALAKARMAIDVASEEVYSARDAWYVASRADLGVPPGKHAS